MKTPPGQAAWAEREGRLCEPAMLPSNISATAVAQEWFNELDAWIDRNALEGYDPFDVKEHPWMQAVQPNPLLRKATSVLSDLAPHSLRKWLGVRPTENPKTYALVALGKLRLYQLTHRAEDLARAHTCLEKLLALRSMPSERLCWGYPFTIRAQGLHTPAGTPIAVLSAMAGQAFSLAYLLDEKQSHLDAMVSIADGMLSLFPRLAGNEGEVCFAYTPSDMRRVHNANLLVAEHLYRTASLTGKASYAEAAAPALRYTLRRQRDDGAWAYGEAMEGDGYDPRLLAVVDHHHTGFVLRSLEGIRKISDDETLAEPIRRGFAFYKRNLISPTGAPLTAHGMYPIDIHACAEAVLCPSVLSCDVLAARGVAEKTLRWAYANMRCPRTGLPWYRKYPMFTSRIHYPRWGTAWIYYAISEYLLAHCRGR